MKVHYKISRAAEQDLREIEDYSAREWGERRTEQYLKEISKTLDRICDNPNIGRTRDDIPVPYKVFAVGSHLIVYRHSDTHQRVEVLNILHPAMNMEQRLHQALTKARKH